MTTNSEMMTPTELAARLRVSTRTLEKWRRCGEGPAAIKLGGYPRSPVRYLVTAVEAWEAQECPPAMAVG